MKTILKIKWGTLRLLFYIFAIVVFLTCGLALYLFAPITSYVFFDDFAFWKHLKNFHKIYLAQLIILQHFIFAHKTGYATMIPLVVPPLMSPNPGATCIAPDWPHAHDHCGGCDSCCGKLGCPLLFNNQCLSYGSFYWRYFNCGRFPENQKQLAFYECRKWMLIKD